MKKYMNCLFTVASVMVATVFSLPSIAIAEPSVDDLAHELFQLQVSAEEINYDVITVQNQIDRAHELSDKLDLKIKDTENKLAVEKEHLSDFMVESYKNDSPSLLDILFNSRSFDELITNVEFANRVIESQNDSIGDVKDLRSMLNFYKTQSDDVETQLSAKLVELEERKEQDEHAQRELNVFVESIPEDKMSEVLSAAHNIDVNDVSSYVGDNVSSEVLEQTVSPVVEDEIRSIENTISSYEAAVESGSVSEEEIMQVMNEVESLSQSSGSNSAVSSVSSDYMSRLYSLLGSGYQWSGYNWTGDTSTSSFTCSGVVDYALGRDSRSSSPESLYSEVNNITTDTSSLSEGDLVFYSYGGREVGHVAVYVGNGQIIDSIPNGGVAVRDVDYMPVVGAGSL